MKQITLTDGVVTAVDDLPEGVTVETVAADGVPRIGSIRIDGHWVAKTHAVLTDDVTGLVKQVGRNKWADEHTPVDGATWRDEVGEIAPGMIRADDGTYAPPPPPRDIAAEVAQHALALKIGVVNATRTDGKTDPVTPEAYAAITARYQIFVDQFNTDINLGDPVSEERKAVVRLIRDGQRFFEAVDTSAASIIAAGDAADPIHTDARWPALPKS